PVPDETVALQVLRGDVASAPENAKRLRPEVKLARRGAHPNVWRIYEYGQDRPRQYIPMGLGGGPDPKEGLEAGGALQPGERFRRRRLAAWRRRSRTVSRRYTAWGSCTAT